MRKSKTITIEYKNPMHLFREELLAIEAILKVDLSGRDFKITFDNFDSEDVSSIPSNQKISNDLSFHISSPYLSIEVRKYSSRFYAAEDSLQIRGAIEKIKDIFDNNIRKDAKVRQWAGLSMKWLTVFLVIFGEVVLIGDIEILRSIVFASSESIFIYILLSILCFTSWVQMTWPLEPIIEFETRGNRKSFWERNKEQIYVGLIVGVPVAIVSFILGLLTGRI